MKHLKMQNKMTFLNICQGDNCLAEVCGFVDITEKHVTISISAEDRLNAMKLVHGIDGAMFYQNQIVIPIECVNYMNESSQFNKELICLTT